MRSEPATVRVVLAAHPTVGHTSALRAIGNRLQEQGHAVSFAVSGGRIPFAKFLPEQVRTVGELIAAIERDFERISLSPALASLWHAARITGKTGYDELEVALQMFTSGLEKHARELAAHVQSWRGDVVVFDYLMPAALLGAQLARVPAISLYHSALPFPVDGAAPFGSSLPDGAAHGPAWTAAEARLNGLLEMADARLTRAAQKLRLPAGRKGFLSQPISSDLNLLNTHAALEPGLLPLEGPVLMTGPCLPRVGAADRDDPALRAFSGKAPRVYLSLGTVFNDQPEVFETILEGIALGAAETVVSAGASYERLASKQRPGVHVFRRVPQVALLAQVDAVVTHGGNNTVQETLASGKPMVVIPFGGDQLANARRIERLEVGAAILPGELTGQRLRSALDVALGAEATACARALGAQLEGIDGTANAAAAIVKLVAARRANAAAGSPSK
jgi:MGT family glycosyltransferase